MAELNIPSSTNKNLVCIITDFGDKDGFVGVMKGVIKSIYPESDFIDITNKIPQGNIFHAAFLLLNCVKYFPKKTIFLCVVDPGVGSDRKIIYAETKYHRFLAPDNGILSFVFERFPAKKIISVENKKFFLKNISNTFHGRDIFAPVCGHILKRINPNLLGSEIKKIKTIKFPELKFKNRKIVGKVIFIDNFGNAVTNIKKADIKNQKYFFIKNKKIPIKESYSDVQKNEYLVVDDSFGFFEIAQRDNNAAKNLKIKTGDIVRC